MKDIIVFDVVCISQHGDICVDRYKLDDGWCCFSTLSNQKLYEKQLGEKITAKQNQALIIYKSHRKVIEKERFIEREVFQLVLKWSRLDKIKLLDKTV